jgi:DNA-directed RNA polymerase subunit M/transcription elongation factor TFIIS
MLVEDFNVAIQNAATSLENIARALIHCYGEKPISEPGQEEALGLLSRRFDGKEKQEFERAIHIASQADTTARTAAQPTLVNKADAEQTLSSASEAIDIFRRILTNHFATEVPELDETCPKCGSLKTVAWNSTQHGTTFECASCHHKWTEQHY